MGTNSFTLGMTTYATMRPEILRISKSMEGECYEYESKQQRLLQQPK